MSFSAKSGALLSSRAPRCWWWWRRRQPSCAAAGPAWSYFGGSRPRPILDMSYSRHFLDFQGSSIPSSMKKLVVTKLSQNFREAVALRQDSPVPLPGDGDLLVRNR